MMKILLFHVNVFKQNSIREIGRVLGIDVCTVSDDDCHKTIGTIAGLPGCENIGKPVPFTDEMMVLCGSDPDSLDRFLEEYHRRQITPIDLKAVLTPYNAKWTPGRLCMELKKERQSIEGQ